MSYTPTRQKIQTPPRYSLLAPLVMGLLVVTLLVIAGTIGYHEVQAYLTDLEALTRG